MIFKNIYLTDGTCVFNNKLYSKIECYNSDLKNSIYWNPKKKKKKINIINVFKNKFIKRK